MVSSKNKFFTIWDFIAIGVCVLVLMLGHLANFWGCMRPAQFEKRALAPTNNGFVMGRMAMNNQKGWGSSGCFLIHVQPHVFPSKLPPDEAEEFRKKRWIYGYRAYVEDFEITYNQPYVTKTAWNAYVYSIFEKIGMSRSFTLKFAVWQKSFLFSLIVALIILLFSKIFGKIAGLLILIAFAYNPYINLFGVGLYFVPWTFFLPFTLASWLLYLDHIGKIKFGLRHYSLLAFSFFFHMAFHSFEFLTTMGVMAVVPFVVFSFLNKTSILRLIRTLAIATAFYFVGIFAGIFLIIAQQAYYYGSYSEAWDHIVFSFSSRTAGKVKVNKSQVVLDRLKASHDIPLSSTYQTYLNKEALQYYSKMSGYFMIPFKNLMVLGVICSILLSLYYLLIKRKLIEEPNYIPAIVVGCWFSLLAPVSWFTIFKGHSNFHPHVNPIIMYMPFMILLMTVIGYTCSLILNRIASYRMTGR